MIICPELRHLFKTMDYSQNLYLPNFSAEQPGNTYYFPHLNMYMLGFIDVLTGNDVIHSFDITNNTVTAVAGKLSGGSGPGENGINQS